MPVPSFFEAGQPPKKLPRESSPDPRPRRPGLEYTRSPAIDERECRGFERYWIRATSTVRGLTRPFLNS